MRHVHFSSSELRTHASGLRLACVQAMENDLMFIRAMAGLAVLSCFVGCGTDRTPTLESANVLSPSAITDSSTASVSSAFAQGRSADVIVNMHDNCDSETFDAALRPGTCVRNGGMKFDHFIEQLTRLGFVGPWHFSPNVVNARSGERFVVINRGGEVHTFTEVDEFGGGIVDDLNVLAQVPKVAPECLGLDPDDFVAPGHTYLEDIEEAGDEKYQCCIHPWMRLTAHISAPHDHP
jgi:hypothetical protein